MKYQNRDFNNKILIQTCRNLKTIAIVHIATFLILFLYFLDSSLTISILESTTPHYGIIFLSSALFVMIYLGRIVANLDEMIFELGQRDKHSREMHLDT